MTVGLSGAEDGVRELGMVHAVGEFLGFEGESATEDYGVSVLVDSLAVTEEIAAVKLQAGLV